MWMFLSGSAWAEDATPTPPATPSEAATPTTTPTPAPSQAPSSLPPSALPPPSQLDQMSLEELLNVPIAVASREAARPLRETAGVVTLVTRDQIASSGARDLTDVLLLVPGFSLGVDVEGVVAPAFRGIWAEEGKVLIMIDGHPMNELLYLNMPLGGRWPIDQIEKVEIIRGPGSAAYGGSAELAVVNIVTRGAAELDGHLHASLAGSQRASSNGMRDLSLQYGVPAATPEGLSYSISLFVGEDNRSDATFVGVPQRGVNWNAPQAGTRWDMANNSGLEDLYLNAQLGWKGWQASLLADQYTINERDDGGYTYLTDTHMQFQQYSFDLRRDFLAGPVTLTPHFAYQRETTWAVLGEHDFFDNNQSSLYDPLEARYLGEVIARAKVMEGLDASAGASFTRDDFFCISTDAGDCQHGLLDQIFGGTSAQLDYGVPFGKRSYADGAVFGEARWSTPYFDAVLGARFEDQTRYGSAFVPRFALTHAFKRAHLKLLAARAFRPPSDGNLDYNLTLKPETTTVLEAEAGYRLSDKAFVTANVFDIVLDRPIVYTIAVNGTANYYNFSHTGSQGAEATFQGEWGPATGTATGSFYTAAGVNRVPDYTAPGHSDLNLGMAHVKLTATASVRLGSGLFAGGSAIWFSERFGVGGYNVLGDAVVYREPPVLLLNAALTWKRIWQQLDLTLGAYNVLGSGFAWDQAYDGGSPKLPAEPREVMLRAGWTL